MSSNSAFDPTNVNLNTASLEDVVCYIYGAGNNYNGELGARISSVFVVLITSTVVTFFPVVAKRVESLKIPNWAYLIARYFGSGVILATAFVHLIDPSYYEIGQNTCVGVTGNWFQYSWPPAFVLLAIAIIFMLDFGAAIYVENKYGITRAGHAAVFVRNANQVRDDDEAAISDDNKETSVNSNEDAELEIEKSYRQKISAFLILEFGVLFHSVIIGLTLGVVGSQFTVLYIVIIFHQAFEGLGIGARLSAIPFPHNKRWLPWVLCSAYGLTTPVSVAIGLGVRTRLNLNSFAANILQGVMDASSGGILVYTALVELIGHDFIFNANRTRDKKELALMVGCFFAGTGIMALIGKWI
jgi:solute carrier family 39 (zinc transporter), member 1/2/3